VSDSGTIDALHHELFEALSERGCPLCELRAISERRIVLHLSRDVTHEPKMLGEFVASGGLCHRHGICFHRTVAHGGSGAEIASAYGALVDRDLAWLDQLGEALSGRGRARAARKLAGRRGGGCYVCARLSRAEARHEEQLLELLEDPIARERYSASDGACFPHLVAILGVHESGVSGSVSIRFVVEDAYRRLRELRRLLGEFDRKREVGLADQRLPEEERSLTRVVRRYVGHEPAPADIPWDPGLADW
jgi:hypothetical protein